MKKIEIHTFSELIAQGKTPEILFWVGCAGSFDERAKKITKAFANILNQANEIEIYAQIESLKGLKNCEDIFSQNIKGFFIGPYDLSASLNNPGVFDSDEFIEAEAKILSAAKAENIKCGYHLVEPKKDQIEFLKAKGYDMIAFSVDIRMLDISARLPFTE